MGVCFLVNKRWNDAKLVSQSCSIEVETLIINNRPFYSPRVFSSVVFVGVYIPPKVFATFVIMHSSLDQVLDEPVLLLRCICPQEKSPSHNELKNVICESVD